MHAHIFTADNLLRIRQMAGEGSSAFEIAMAIGSTPASVRVICSRHKIKLTRKPALNPSSDHAIVVHMPAWRSIRFHRKAERLQIPASVLAKRLLAAIVVSNIYDAVFDDND